MSSYSQFQASARRKAGDQDHRLKILKAVSTYDDKVTAMKTSQFRNWESAREQAEKVKNFVLGNLADLLVQFERNITEHGAEVIWARRRVRSGRRAGRRSGNYKVFQGLNAQYCCHS